MRQRRKFSRFRLPPFFWYALVTAVVLLAAVLVLIILGKSDFPKAQKIDPLKLAECQNRIVSSTVKILGKKEGDVRERFGSGVVIGEMMLNGEKVTLILTAAHVVIDTRGREYLIVENYNRYERLNEIRVIKTVLIDQDKDLAVVAIPFNPNLSPIPIASELPKIREEVHVFGCLGGNIPCLAVGPEGYKTVITRIESRPAGPDATKQVEEYAIGADREPPSKTPVHTGGISGGPVVNNNGQIIGICSSQSGQSGRFKEIVICVGLEAITTFLNPLPLLSPEERYLENLIRKYQKMMEEINPEPAPAP